MAGKFPFLARSAVKKIFVFFTALFAISMGFASNAQTAKLAIVIDDIGYHPKEDAAIYAMPKQVSVAIIPSSPYAKQRNQQAQQQERDILIHMPMQPVSNIKIEEGGLFVGMSAQEVSQRVQNAKNIVNFAIGMNNHMGSAATADAPLMTALMTELRKQHLFFLDSRTIGKTVAGKIAKEQGVKLLERHIFLDASDELSDVQHQFQQAIQYARKHGIAVVIGHPRKNTVAVLQAGLATLPPDIQLVGVGALWRGEQTVPPKPFIMLFDSMAKVANQALSIATLFRINFLL